MALGRHPYVKSVGRTLCVATLLTAFSPFVVFAQTAEPATLIIRSDDAGMSHSVNMAL